MPEEVPVGPAPGDVAFGHVPDWMDSTFFEKSLRAGLEDPGLRVTGNDVRAATGKGENYVSIVYAARVTTVKKDGERDGKDEEEHHLIIKCLPSNKARRLMSNNAEFFRKEVDMYEMVFPEYKRLAIGRGVTLPWPRHYSTLLDGEGDYLVMDDLRVAGYVMTDRLAGLDPAHLGAALRALAKFHAFSYALQLKEPEVFRTKVYDRFPETMFAYKSEEMMDMFIKQAYGDTADAIREWGEPKHEMIADWMHAVKGTSVRQIIELLSPDDPGAVLNHGDFWVNNMLFRYPSGEGAREPADVRLLDFQIARVCSPAADLSYLLATSITKVVREAHWEALLQNAYHDTFWETLEALGAKEIAKARSSELFTWPWLQSEMRRFLPFALCTSVTTATVVLAESSDAPDMDTMTEDQLLGKDLNNPFAHLVKAKLYQERLRGLLDFFLEQGVFQ
ncbi:uncharacterized protein LOC124158558 [Ischnura elegans]|uniref:uncharacterized protein LOC124158558 n=1 Tax=Ischnura elegans TaxID=197161 RepID=UPI001ED87A15|nr:uncharacterized protein LOC124158558 [Ischnura elegans]